MIGMHIIFLRTDCLNKALCQSATSLFIVVGRGSVVSENMLFWKKKRFLIAPAGINLAYIKCERRVTSVFCRLPPHTGLLCYLLEENGNSAVVQTWTRGHLWRGGADPSVTGLRCVSCKSGMKGAPWRRVRDPTSFTPDSLGPELFRSFAPQWCLPDNLTRVALHTSFLRMYAGKLTNLVVGEKWVGWLYSSLIYLDSFWLGPFSDFTS